MSREDESGPSPEQHPAPAQAPTASSTRNIDTEMHDSGAVQSSPSRTLRSRLRKRSASLGGPNSSEAGPSSASIDEESSEGARHGGENKDLGRRIRRRMSGKGKGRLPQDSDPGRSSTSPDVRFDSKSRKGKERETHETTDVSSEAAPSSQPAVGHDAASVGFIPPLAEETAGSNGRNVPAPTPSEPVSSPTAQMERQNRVRSQVRAALGIAGLAGHHSEGEADGTTRHPEARPSMLSALLSDVLGLRSSRPNAADASTDSGSVGGQTAGGVPPQQRSANGGTSVIVQGALMARTVSPDERERQMRSSRPPASTRPTSAFGSDAPASVQETQGADDAHLESPANPTEGEGGMHSATIEEQARMLIRLLSIATAATAASLVSAPPVQTLTAAPSSAAAAQRTNDGPGMPASNGDHTPPVPPSSTATSLFPASRRRSSSWIPSVRPAFRGLRTGLASIRSRFPSFERRMRPSRAAQTAPGPSLPESTTTRSGLGDSVAPGVQAGAMPANSQPTAYEVPESQTSSDMPGQEQPSATSLTSTLSTMLREAIRDGISSPSRLVGGDRRSTETDDASPNEAFNEARSRARNLNSILGAVRDGVLSPGGEGSFERFLFDLTVDLNVAVRRLPIETTSTEGADAALGTSGETASIDATTRARRQRDTQDGQLSFFRFYRFPPLAAAGSNQSAAPNPNASLQPCVVVGVRSIDVSEGSGPGPTSQPAAADSAVPEQQPSEQSTATGATSTEPTEAQGGSGGGDADEATNPTSRFVLFVSGGHYPPHHPLFQASDEEASHDLMVLMEFMGAMAAMNAKPNTTVTQEQIDNSNLRSVNGTRAEIETLVLLKQVMENTSHHCLVCLEDWSDAADAEQRRLLDCGHLFHAQCLDKWLISSNNSCPVCRRQAVTTNGAPAPAPMPPSAAAAAAAAATDGPG